MRRNPKAARIAVRPSSATARRCAIKGHYVKLDGRGPAEFAKSARLHMAYVERDGVERDGSRGVLYGAEVAARPDEHRHRMLQPHAAEEHQFRFTVSPEDAQELDLTAFVRELMKRVEKDTGLTLEWSAVNHYNTAHPHAHVIVRGVDRQGRPIRFDQAYIKRGFRERAQTLATEWLGPRTAIDLRRQSEREVSQTRWTQLDRRIELKARERGGFVSGERLDSFERRRMQVLEQLGLVQRAGVGFWVVRGWREQLRSMGERNDIVKQMHRAMPGVDASRFVVMDESLPRVATEGQRSYGRVVELGLREDTPNGMYALVETSRGTGFYLPLRRNQVGQLREGDVVVMRSWTDRKGAPRVSFDRQRLSLEQQVQYVGPTWLDSASASGASPFAREVMQRQRQRAEFLRERGIKRSSLQRLERQTVAQQFAAKRRSRICGRVDGFEGQVIACHEAASGTRYWVLEGSDGLLAVRADKRASELVGRDVRIGLVERDGHKRVELDMNQSPER